MLKLYLIILVVFLVSCEKSGIMTYKVPKQTISVAQLSVDKQINNIIWVIPDTWIEQDQTQFRVSSYKVPFGDNPTIWTGALSLAILLVVLPLTEKVIIAFAFDFFAMEYAANVIASVLSISSTLSSSIRKL